MLKSVKKRHLWLYIIAVVASLGGLLSGFDTGVISGALIFINETWSMTPLEQGWVVSSAIVGAVIGAALNGVLSDIYGRKKIIIATGIIFALGSVFCAYAVSVHWLMASRMIIGLAVGMVNFIIPLYLSEISPQKYAECWFLFSACNYRRNFILLPHQPRFCQCRIQLALDVGSRSGSRRHTPGRHCFPGRYAALAD